MKRSSCHFVGLALGMSLGMSTPALSEGGDGAGLSPSQTTRVVEVLESGFLTCSKTEPVYRMDCYSQVYRNGSKVLANNASYWEAEVALTRVGRNLYTFVRANTDSSIGRIRADGFRVKAIQPSAMNKAENLYRQTVARAEILLRSTGDAEQRYFGPIADEVARYPELAR